MGAHAKGPGKLLGEDRTLADLIEADPIAALGGRVAERFDHRLPFLFKILDVRQMLSIQVHPTKQAAEEGFAREEASGPARTAPNRNYRDDNHKPELGVALTAFYLLHGFKSAASIRDTLTGVPGWDVLLPALERGGVASLYQEVMEATQDRVDKLLQPLVDHLTATEGYTRDQPEFWAKRAVAQYTKEGHHDRGIFSIFWFNLVHLKPGEGIFQDAGVPHAYLEGVCIELMANSDNVLRGGLTPKHIDVPELLDKTRFEAITPNILTGRAGSGNWTDYPTPAPDFALSKTEVSPGDSITVDTTGGPAILLLLKGGIESPDLKLDARHRTIFVPVGKTVVSKATENSLLYLARPALSASK